MKWQASTTEVYEEDPKHFVFRGQLNGQPRKILFSICNQRTQRMEHQKTEVRHSEELQSVTQFLALS